MKQTKENIQIKVGNIVHDTSLDKYSAIVLFPDKIEKLIKLVIGDSK
jgi:hypothetical protein